MSETPAIPQPASLAVRLAQEGRMFFRFAVVGAMGFLIDATLLKIGIACGLAKPIARLISILVSMHFAFAANRAWAFKGLRGQSLVRQWLGYLTANSAGALLNYTTFLALSRHGAWFERAPILAAAAGTAAGMLVNFSGSRLLAFRR
jgi:putative flippase GtrA